MTIVMADRTRPILFEVWRESAEHLLRDLSQWENEAYCIYIHVFMVKRIVSLELLYDMLESLPLCMLIISKYMVAFLSKVNDFPNGVVNSFQEFLYPYHLYFPNFYLHNSIFLRFLHLLGRKTFQFL